MIFDIDVNFWSIYKDLKIVPEFKAILDSDKSKDKNKASTIMWALFMLYHPESNYANAPMKDKMMLIKKDFLKDENFDFEQYKEAIDYIKKLLTPKEVQLLNDWLSKLEQRTEFIASIKYDVDTAEMLDSLLKSTEPIWKGYEATKKRLQDSGAGITKGGAEESISEKGLI